MGMGTSLDSKYQVTVLVLVAVLPLDEALAQTSARGNYQALVTLFEQWREFERPPLRSR